MADEYIRKADAIRWVKTECNPYGKPTLDFESGKKVIEHLERMHSADVVPVRHAEWIRTESFVNGIVTRIYKCSCCDGVAGVRADNGFWYKSNFCPNCGAKMDGGENG